ncbi:MAG: hypothetical protein NTZ13_04010 [Candidatus Parcubacteria bacterium]|nr:hypothetical protein [Candidatus Parcubacteria bacterium]
MEKSIVPEYINPLKSEHLNEGIKPIIACINSMSEEEEEKKFGKFRELVYTDNTRGIRNVDFYGDPIELSRKGFKNVGEYTYVISTIDDANKFSEEFKNCTGVIVTGQDKNTGKDISFLSHEDPWFFVEQEGGTKKFTEDLRAQLLEIKNRCIPGTIDAVIAGGNYFKQINETELYTKRYRDNYQKSIEILSKEISDILGFEPAVIIGPKALGGSDKMFYDNAGRQLHIYRRKTGDETSESYIPRDFEKKKEDWEKSPDHPTRWGEDEENNGGNWM